MKERAGQAFGLTLIAFGNLGTPTAFLWVAPLLGAAAYG